MRQTIEENHRIGKMKQKIKVTGRRAIAVYYPHLGSAEIDANIEAAVKEAIEKFEQENQGVEGLCTLYADYESYELNERYGSVQDVYKRQGLGLPEKGGNALEIAAKELLAKISGK